MLSGIPDLVELCFWMLQISFNKVSVKQQEGNLFWRLSFSSHYLLVYFTRGSFSDRETMQTKAFRECTPLPRHVIISTWENVDFFCVQCSRSVSVSNMGSNLDQEESSYFLS